jgi:putative intracellular protease/amidase
LNIAIPIFDGFTALDAVGPYEVLSRLPGATVRFLAAAPGPVRDQRGACALLADMRFAGLPQPEVIVVPGGRITPELLADEQLLAWLRHAHRHSQWTASVCTGSLLLGAAGILGGRLATSHWLTLEFLTFFGAEPVRQRVVEDGKIITAAGVSAGIDMALTLAAHIGGPRRAQEIQLAVEYDPRPPFDCGSPEKARAEIVEAVRAAARASA